MSLSSSHVRAAVRETGALSPAVSLAGALPIIERMAETLPWWKRLLAFALRELVKAIEEFLREEGFEL